jgi:hypothetical protein
LELTNPEFAAHHKMLHLSAHRDDPPVDWIRDVVQALAISLVDLGRLNARTAAEVVKLRHKFSEEKSTLIIVP